MILKLLKLLPTVNRVVVRRLAAGDGIEQSAADARNRPFGAYRYARHICACAFIWKVRKQVHHRSFGSRPSARSCCSTTARVFLPLLMYSRACCKAASRFCFANSSWAAVGGLIVGGGGA